MKVFQVGDSVRFLNETGTGKVIAKQEDLYLVLRDDGLELEYSGSELVQDLSIEHYRKAVTDEEKFIKQKLGNPAKRGQRSKPAPKKGAQMVVDLHIYEILDNYQHLSSGEMLRTQVLHFRKKLKEAMEKRYSRVVFIHGVGEGVLRSEIRLHLRDYDNIEFLDASYEEFGAGATEVFIRYN